MYRLYRERRLVSQLVSLGFRYVSEDVILNILILGDVMQGRIKEFSYLL